MSRRERMAAIVSEIAKLAKRLDGGATFMEVCGTHTVSACRGGVHSLMPENVRLVSGPGCPVCVTAQRYLDALIDLGKRDDVTLATYGDLMRVTGSGGSLERARSEGADVRVVNSTMEAVEIARAEPGREVVFAAVGFETTAPATAAAVKAARREGLANFSVLPCHKLVPPAMEALLADPEIRIDGFLCPGHVSVIIGANAYRPVVEEHGKPCAVAGFDPIMIAEGILSLTRQVASGEPRLENLYPQVVSAEGNRKALELIDEVFVPADSAWRALGTMKASGLDLRPGFADQDAFRRFDIELAEDNDPPGCLCGEVITGRAEPPDCVLFGEGCTPVEPVGPCMVSSEGTCQAWYKYRRNEPSRAARGEVRS